MAAVRDHLRATRLVFFFFNDTATTEIYTLSLHDALPICHPQWSPRVGFNWDVTGDQRNQIRGGAGVFVGRPPLAWLLSAYANFGKGLGVLTCNGNPPPFDPDYANPPLACASGSGTSTKPVVTFLDPDLKFPETLRATLGYDRRLPWGLVATVEGLYTKNLDDFFYADRNLAGPIGVRRPGRSMYRNVGTHRLA